MYFIATNHEEFAAANFQFPDDSVVIDPWRYIGERPGVEVIPVGLNRGEAAKPPSRA